MEKLVRVDNDANGQWQFVPVGSITKVIVETANGTDFVLKVITPSYTGHIRGGAWSSADEATDALRQVLDVRDISEA